MTKHTSGKSAKTYRIERDNALKDVETQKELYRQLLNGRARQMREAFEKGYHKGKLEIDDPLNKKRLKEEYNKGYEKGHLVATREAKETNKKTLNVPEGYESYENLILTRNTWARRGQYAEAEVKRLKSAIGQAFKSILEEL